MIEHLRADKTGYQAYSFDPLANLTSAEAANILGGEQLLWTEQSDPSSMSSSRTYILPSPASAHACLVPQLIPTILFLFEGKEGNAPCTITPYGVV